MALEATAGKVVVNHWAKMEEFSAYLLNDVNKKKLFIIILIIKKLLQCSSGKK